MKNGKKKKVIFIGIICLVLVTIIMFIFFKNKYANSDNAVLKDDVYIITEEIETSLKEVNEESLIFDKEVNYKAGDVIVSGITEMTPNGFIKIVIDSYTENGRSILSTEEGFLTDVFEELHIKRKFSFTENGIEELNIVSRNYNTNGLLATKFINESLFRNLAVSIQMTDEENTGYPFLIEKEIKLDKYNSIEVSVGCNFELELTMDIENEELVYGMIVHSDLDGELALTWSEKAGWEKTGTIKEIELPNLQFFIGAVPIVITNEVNIGYELESEVSGGIKTEVEVDSKASIGFIYDSSKEEIEKITEYEYLSDGLSFGTSVFAKGEVYGGLTTHIASKLYGVAGGYIGGGIGAKLEGEIALKDGIVVSAETLDTEHAGVSFEGSLDLSVLPKIEGGFIKKDLMDIDVDVNFDDIKKEDEDSTEKDNEQENTEKNSEQDDKQDNGKDDENDNQKDNGKNDSEDEKTPLLVIEFEPLWNYHWEVVSISTYKTQTGSLYFDCPSTWEVEEYTEFSEGNTLTNSNGTQIYYMDFGATEGGGYGSTMYEIELTEVAETKLEVHPYNKIDYEAGETYVVAKVKIVASMTRGLQDDFEPTDGATYYAVIPKSYLGSMYTYPGDGIYRDLAFAGNNANKKSHSIIARSEDGEFSEDEVKEIIEILSSFRWTID